MDTNNQEFGADLHLIPMPEMPQTTEREGLSKHDIHKRNGLPLLCSQIVQEHRFHKDYQQAALRLNNQILALIRRICGLGKGDLGKAEKIRKQVLSQAAPVATSRTGESDSKEKGEDHAPADTLLRDAFPLLASAIVPLETAKNDIEGYGNAYRKRLEKLAKQLPVWPWIEGVRGVGAHALAQIIGETTTVQDGQILTIGDYANPGKVWKRMGVGLVNRPEGSERQRKVAGKTPEAIALAIEHGYNPRRRSVMFVIGDCLVKQNDGEYRRLYDERKTYELARAPEMKPMHAHLRAKRYMEKRFLKNLWQEWRAICRRSA